jgi:muconolactone delta-isomerase
MLFLVRGENIDAGYLIPPEQVFQTLEQAIIPSFQMLAERAADGKAWGGSFPGERSGAAIIEAESFEELDAFMNSLPFFGLVKWDIKPLMPFSVVAEQLPQYISRAREMMAGAGGSS